MTRALKLVLVGYLLLCPGCKNASQDLADRSFALLEGGLLVLEAHQNNPEQAPAAFRDYVEQNKSGIEALERFSQELARKDDKENAAAVRRRFLERIKALTPRLRAVAAIYGGNTEVMTALKNIQPRVSQ